MLTLRSIRLKDIVLYEKAEVNFTAPIYVVRGLNKDRTAKNSRSAAGKTFFFSTIPSVLYGAPPTSLKKNTAKSSFGKEGELEIIFEKSGKQLSILQASKGRSLKTTIKTDKKTFDYREFNKAKAHIAKISPVSEDQFYTFNYLAVRRFHPLLDGKATQRFEFFEKVFEHMDVFDDTYRKISERYNTMKVQAAAMNRQLERLEQEKKESPVNVNVPKLKKTLRKISRLVNKLIKKSESIRLTAHRASTFIAVFNRYEGKFQPLGTLEAKKEQAEILLSKLNKAYRKAIKAEEAMAAYKKNQKRIESLQTELEGKFSEVDTSILNAENKEFVSKIPVLKAEAKSIASYINKAKKALEESQLKRLRKAIGKSFIQNSKQSMLDKVKDELAYFTGQIERLDNMETDEKGRCAVCGHPVSLEHIEKEKKEFKAKWNELIARKGNIVDSLRILSLEEEDAQHKRQITEGTERLYRLKKVIARFEKIQAQMERAKERNSREQRIEDLKMGKPLPFKYASKELNNRIEHVARNNNRLSRAIEAAKALEELDHKFDSVEVAKIELEKANEQSASTLSALTKYNKQKEKLTITLAKAEASQKSISILQEQIERDKKETKDFSIYEGLREAYGAKGIRLYAIESLAREFISNMNMLSHLLYSESITFSYHIAKGTFDIFATRNTRNPKPEDVRSLSGMEANAFKALCVLALMPMVPVSKRFGFIIMDEIEANMDEASRSLLINQFLPMLQRVVPLVIFITPKSKKEFDIPKANELLVTKKNGVATITEGSGHV